MGHQYYFSGPASAHLLISIRNRNVARRLLTGFLSSVPNLGFDCWE